jgi:N-acetylneuraminate synthase
MVKIIAEIGLNYAYGKDKSQFLDNAKKLIDVAVVAGCDWVKFQKRNPDLCVPSDQKGKDKTIPWGEEQITYLQYKWDIELGQEEYDEINKYCLEKGIGWFASVWDKDSVDFMSQYKTGGRVIMKIPSALITDLDLCRYAKEKSDLLIISTGMSTEDEIRECIKACDPDVIMHSNSSYPSQVDELRLDYIKWLKDHVTTNAEIGYSGHEFGLITTIAAVCLGANWIERHLTLDRTLWGSDQMASVEPQGMIKLVKGIRDIERARGGFGPREVIGSELIKRKSLRGA